MDKLYITGGIKVVKKLQTALYISEQMTMSWTYLKVTI